MVLSDILRQIWSRDAAYLFAKGTGCEYRLYVYGKEDWGLHGSLTCFKKNNSGWGHPFDVNDYRPLMKMLNDWAGEDLNKLDWKPRRPIT